MENEQKKSKKDYHFYIIVIGFILCAIIYCAVRSCGNDTEPAELYQRTDAAVGAVEKQHEAIGRELDFTGGQLDRAGKTVQRADDIVDRSQECVIRNAESVIECKQIVSECRKIVADCQRIYAEAEEANRTGAGSGS